MKIFKNTSLFDTRKLSALFGLIHKQLAHYEGRLPHWSTLRVKVITRNGRGKPQRDVSGMACVGKPSIYRKWDWDIRMSINTFADMEWIAQVFAHELMHSYGYKHHQYRRYPLEEQHLTAITKEFGNSAALLSDKAFHTPKKRVSYKQKCKDLMKEFEWLSIERHPREEFREIEVNDDRDDCLCYEDKNITCTCDRVFDMRMDYRAPDMNWKKAYESAMLLILRDITVKE